MQNYSLYSFTQIEVVYLVFHSFSEAKNERTIKKFMMISAQKSSFKFPSHFLSNINECKSYISNAFKAKC